MANAASTAGKTSRLVRTERTAMSVTDFSSEIFKLEGTSEHSNILIYGNNNSGKTWLAGTAPGRCMWLVGEPGYKSAARNGAKGLGRRITDPAAAWAAVDWLEQNYERKGIEWVIIDGGTTMNTKFRLAYTAEAFDINPLSRAHRNLPDKPDYFNAQNFMISWAARLVDIPVNTLWTFHAWRTEKSRDVDLLVYPGIQGGVAETASAVVGLMDATGYLQVKRIRSRNDPSKSKLIRRLHFETPDNGPDGDDVQYLVGDKFDAFGPYVDSPTIPKLMAAIEGEK
jgi:hypothetical protein